MSTLLFQSSLLDRNKRLRNYKGEPIGQLIGAGTFAEHAVIPARMTMKINGSANGSTVPSRDVPKFVDLYKRGELRIDEMVTRRIELEGIDAALDAMGRGEGAR